MMIPTSELGLCSGMSIYTHIYITLTSRHVQDSKALIVVLTSMGEAKIALVLTTHGAVPLAGGCPVHHATRVEQGTLLLLTCTFAVFQYETLLHQRKNPGVYHHTTARA